MKKRITVQLGRELLLKDLYNPEILQELIRKLIKKYDEVKKPEFFIPMNRPQKETSAGILDGFLHHYLKGDGITNVLSRLSAMSKYVDHKNAIRAKERIVEHLRLASPKSLRLKKELDKKFNDECAFLIESCFPFKECI